MQQVFRNFWRITWYEPFRRPFLWFLLVTNGIGAVSGYFWYEGQLATTSWYGWFFVPDSPLSATLFTLALAGWLGQRQWSLFYLLATTAVIKYGVWAVILIVDYWVRGGQPTFLEVMLFLSHIGMAVEGVIYLRHLAISAGQVGLIAVWMLFSDWIDYGRGLHPYLYRPDQWLLAMLLAVSLSVVLGVAAWGRSRKLQEFYAG